jgi:hypothetical protein
MVRILGIDGGCFGEGFAGKSLLIKKALNFINICETSGSNFLDGPVQVMESILI